MSKIVTAVNAMILNTEKISDVLYIGWWMFFLYDGKYVWSIRWDEPTDQYYLCLYPDLSMERLESLSDLEWEHVRSVTYSTEELKTREAKESFAELYLIVKEKAHGVDRVLDDIIGTSENWGHEHF